MRNTSRTSAHLGPCRDQRPLSRLHARADPLGHGERDARHGILIDVAVDVGVGVGVGVGDGEGVALLDAVGVGEALGVGEGDGVTAMALGVTAT